MIDTGRLPPPPDPNTAYETVGRALGAGRYESLAQAAFRVTRQNCLPPHVLGIARRILACSGKPGAEQTRTLVDCAAILEWHAHEAARTKRKDPP